MHERDARGRGFSPLQLQVNHPAAASLIARRVAVELDICDASEEPPRYVEVGEKAGLRAE